MNSLSLNASIHLCTARTCRLGYNGYTNNMRKSNGQSRSNGDGPLLPGVATPRCTGHETNSHKKTYSAHKCFFPKMLLHVLIPLHSTYRNNSDKMLHKRNCMPTQTLQK